MLKINNLIFNVSPKTLATMLIVVPVLAFLFYIISTIVINLLFSSSSAREILIGTSLGMSYLFLGIVMVLWASWLGCVVYAVDESTLGIARKWFRWAFALFIIYVVFSLCFSFFDAFPEVVRHILRVLNEPVAAAGLLIAYPTLCHFAARAIYAKRNKSNAGFANAIPYTLMLIFGTVLSIPFFHRHFSSQSSTNSEIIKIYVRALAICAVLFVVGFIAAVTGLI